MEEFSIRRLSSPKDEASSLAFVSDLISKLELVGRIGHEILEDVPSGMSQRLSRALSLAKISTETPLQSVRHAMSHGGTAAALKICTDLSVFKTLSQKKEAKFTTEALRKSLTSQTDSRLLGRILSYAASQGLIDEPLPQSWQANARTHALAKSAGASTIEYSSSCLDPVWTALPGTLADNDYEDPVTTDETPFQAFHESKTSHHEWLKQNPDTLAHYSFSAALQSQMIGNWIGDEDVEASVVNFPALLANPTKRKLFVDVAGGIGRECTALLESHPDMAGKVVLEDDERVLGLARKASPRTLNGAKVEAVAIDLFDGQPVLGARVYQLRHTLMAYPNNQCLVILGHVVDAMAADSRLVIDEMLAPEPGNAGGAAVMGGSPVLAQTDMNMMLFGGLLRSRDEWLDLLDSAGLEVEGIHQYGERELNTHAIVAKKA